ncbi:MAG: YhcH/YjgK/YiaL family protein [Lactobacillaceae bacterium]|jgi:beta-galactosidase beta subunit|nr:YhcH/YjgK/YiaL family protein [Lactobacillaceae bacterium]
MKFGKVKDNEKGELGVALGLFSQVEKLLGKAPAGVYEAAAGVRLIVAVSRSGTIGNYKLEWHEKFTDTHLPLVDTPSFLIGGKAAPFAQDIKDAEFDKEKDIGFLGSIDNCIEKRGNKLVESKLARGDYAYFEPGEPHASGNYVKSPKDEAFFKKAVIKVAKGIKEQVKAKDIEMLKSEILLRVEAIKQKTTIKR